jgi:hypothetical protein
VPRDATCEYGGNPGELARGRLLERSESLLDVDFHEFPPFVGALNPETPRATQPRFVVNLKVRLRGLRNFFWSCWFIAACAFPFERDATRQDGSDLG